MSSVELFTREEVLAGLPAKRARALMFLIERRSADLAARDGAGVFAAGMAAATLEVPTPLLTAQLWVEKELLDASGERSDSARAQPGDADDAFLRAFGQSRSPCASIGQIERYAHEWAPLVPDNPRLRAAVTRLLGQKYRFTQRSIPGIRRALGLDEPAVQRAYERQYGEPLEGIYAPQVRASERLRWLMVGVGKWLDRRPPFWFAFAFTLTETVGMTILALPIALARVGPLPGIAILAIMGAINLLTVLYQAEAVVRSGTIRYRHAFFGRLVADYLGKTGSLFFSAFLWILAFLALQGLYIGFATALANATQISPMVWAAGLFAACLYFVSRRTLHATAASALLIGAVNIGLILGLSTLALAHLKGENLRYAQLPFVAGRPFDPAILSLVFGVGMVAYFGHISIGNSARLVLARDPSGRGLIGGSVAATGTAFLLNALFVVTVQGAVGPRALAGYAGTALEPLAHLAGPGTWVLGSPYVILGLGMTAVHVSLWLYNLVGERLPPRPHFLAVLRVGGERLLLEAPTVAGDGPRIGLSYLGLDDGRARFRIEFQGQTGLHARETTIAERWEIGELPGGVPVLQGTGADGGRRRQGVRLELHLVEANPESARFVAHSNLRVSYEADTEGTGVLGLFELPDALWEILPWVLRRGEVTLAEATGHLRQDETDVRAALDSLVSHGVLQRAGDVTEPRYRARAARRRPRVLPDRLRTALEELEGTTGRCRRRGRVPARAKRGEGAATGRRGDKTSPAMTTSLRSAVPPRLLVSPSPRRQRRLREALLGERGRLFLCASPLGAGLLLTEWLFSRNSQSFTGLSNFRGLILICVLGGIFPVLLLGASRRKGEVVSSFAWRWLGSPWVLGALYLTFLASLLVHGLFLWQSLPARAAALATAALTVAATVVMARRGAFAPRMVVELCEDLREGQPSRFSILVAGQPLAAPVRLDYGDDERQFDAASGTVAAFSSLHSATFHLPRTDARELKVWTRRVTPEGDSEVLPAFVELLGAPERRRLDLGLSRGQAVLALSGDPCRLQITLTERIP